MFESHSNACYLVVVRATLEAGEHSVVDSVFEVVHDRFAGLLFYFPHAFPIEDEARSEGNRGKRWALHERYTTQRTQNFGAHFAPTQEV